MWQNIFAEKQCATKQQAFVLHFWSFLQLALIPAADCHLCGCGWLPHKNNTHYFVFQQFSTTSGIVPSPLTNPIQIKSKISISLVARRQFAFWWRVVESATNKSETWMFDTGGGAENFSHFSATQNKRAREFGGRFVVARRGIELYYCFCEWEGGEERKCWFMWMNNE